MEEIKQPKNRELMRSMRRLGHYLYHNFRNTDAQNSLLCILKQNGTMSQKEISSRLSIQAGSLSELVSKVEAKGYIIRTEDETNKRMINVSLTELGLQQALLYDQVVNKKAETLFSCLNESEKEELLKLTNKLETSWLALIEEQKEKEKERC